MVEFAPSTGGLALWVKHHDHPPTSDAPAVTTDGNTLFYGPSFEALPLPEQIGLVAHEVLHIALRHPQRFLELKQLLGGVDLKLYNICADAIVNSSLSHLGWLRLPRGAVLLDALLWTTLGIKTDAQAALLEWDVERLYRAMDDRDDNTQKSQSFWSSGNEKYLTQQPYVKNKPSEHSTQYHPIEHRAFNRTRASGCFYVCIVRVATSACQPVPDAFVRIPSSERSSAKSPCRQVNVSSGPLQPLINCGKNTERDAIAPACAAAVPAARKR